MIDEAKIGQLRQVVRNLTRAGHVDRRQGLAFFEVLDAFEIKDEEIQPRDTPKPKSRNNKAHKRSQNRNS